MIDQFEIETRFTYHPPKLGQPEKYIEIRDAGKAREVYDRLEKSYLELASEDEEGETGSGIVASD